MANKDYVRLNRTNFSNEWEVVKVNAKGLITWRKPIDPRDVEKLEQVYQEAQADRAAADA